MNVSIRRWSLAGTQSSALYLPEAVSPIGTCPAMRDGRSDTSNDWIARIPDSPAVSRPQTLSRPRPSGVTNPIPVTTTRLTWRSRSSRSADSTAYRAGGSRSSRPSVARRSAMRLDEAYRVLHGDDLLGRVVGDFAPELFLERHHQLDRVEAVGAQIIDKTGIFSDLGVVDAKVLYDDLFDPIGDVAHPFCPRLRGKPTRLDAARAPQNGRFPGVWPQRARQGRGSHNTIQCHVPVRVMGDFAGSNHRHPAIDVD